MAGLTDAWNWSCLRRIPEALPAGAVGEQVQPTHERLYFPLGEALLVQTNDAAILAALDETFGRFPAPREGSGERVPARPDPLLIRLYVHDVSPDPLCLYEKEYPRPLVRTQGHLLYITAGAENTAVADLAHGRAFGFVTPGVVRNPAFVRYAFLESLAYILLCSGRQFVPVHAAAVVKNGVSLLLIGDSGQGKTTLAFACARRGYQVLAEDVVYARVSARGLRLWSTPWKLHLLQDSVDLFPELRGLKSQLQMNGEWKLEVELEDFYPGSTTTSAEPGLVLSVQRRAQAMPTRIEPVREASSLVQAGIVWPFWVGWTEEMDRQVAGLWRRGGYRLFMNGSPDEAVDALDELLASIPAFGTGGTRG